MAMIGAVLFTGSQLSAQDAAPPLVFFLGRSDGNADGIIDAQDAVAVFASDEAGRTTQISTTDEAVLNYRANPAHDRVAFIAFADGALSLVIASLDGSRTLFPLPSLSFALIEQFDDFVTLTARSNDGSILLVTIDAATGATLGEQTLPSDAEVRINADTSAAAVYSGSASSASLYSLPDLSPLPVTLPIGVGRPSWSPAGSMLALAGDTALYLVDSAAANTRTIDLPMSPDAGSIHWSSAGRFVSLAVPAPAEGPSSALLVDTADGSTQLLSDPARDVRLQGWADGDSAALVSLSQYVDSTLTIAYALLTPMQPLVPLDTINFVRPQALAWVPQTTQLGILGQSFLDGQSGLFALDIRDQTLNPVYSTADASFADGTFQWTSDGAGAVIVSLASDPLELLLGVSYQISYLDRASGTLTRLSPSSVAPLTYGLQIR